MLRSRWNIYNNKYAHLFDSFLIKSANSVFEDDFRHALVSSGKLSYLMGDGYSELDCTEEYLKEFPKWILRSSNNRFLGLEAFKFRFVSLGCTQAIDEFHYWCSLNRFKIRVFKGEYPYSRENCGFSYKEDFIECRPLENGDAVIISLPFSAYADVHKNWSNLLKECNAKKIPILVDCAFFGTCSGIEVDLDQPCIVSVAFSTTKGLSCGSYRSGIAFSRLDWGHLSMQTSWHHGIHLNSAIGLYLMQNFSPDYVYEKYKSAYHNTCEYYGLTPTKCIHLALGGEGWEHFSRDGVCNRVGVRNAVKAMYRGELL